MQNKIPFVYICGAGPGAKDLLTLKAYDILTKQADCVIYDRLIGAEILDLIPSHVNKIYAGKSCKKHEMDQDSINKTIVSEAKKGQVVVRLKGGDPAIYSRAGEEIAALLTNKIDFEIVPGISAASGAAAALGIPLTLRGEANGVRFITGHMQKDQEIDLNWKELAVLDATLVIYMGLVNLELITKNLQQHGLAGTTPAVAIENATNPGMRTCYSTLAKIHQDTTEQNFVSPTIVIIGKVAHNDGVTSTSRPA